MQEHGHYTVVLEHNLLNISLSGTLNEQTALSAYQEIQKSIESLNGEKVAVLVNCVNYEGSTPQAHKISNQSLFWLNQQNCIARATVYSQKIYLDIAKNEQPAIFSMKNRREFSCPDEAKAWLVNQL